MAICRSIGCLVTASVAAALVPITLYSPAASAAPLAEPEYCDASAALGDDPDGNPYGGSASGPTKGRQGHEWTATGHFNVTCQQSVSVKVIAEFYSPSTGRKWTKDTVIRLTNAAGSPCFPTPTSPCSGSGDSPPQKIPAPVCRSTINISATGQVYPANEVWFTGPPLKTFNLAPSSAQPCT